MMKRIFRDERETNEIRKIQSDCLQFVTYFLLVSILIQQIINVPTKQYIA